MHHLKHHVHPTPFSAGGLSLQPNFQKGGGGGGWGGGGGGEGVAGKKGVAFFREGCSKK